MDDAGGDFAGSERAQWCYVTLLDHLAATIENTYAPSKEAVHFKWV